MSLGVNGKEIRYWDEHLSSDLCYAHWPFGVQINSRKHSAFVKFTRLPFLSSSKFSLFGESSSSEFSGFPISWRFKASKPRFLRSCCFCPKGKNLTTSFWISLNPDDLISASFILSCLMRLMRSPRPAEADFEVSPVVAVIGLSTWPTVVASFNPVVGD